MENYSNGTPNPNTTPCICDSGSNPFGTQDNIRLVARVTDGRFVSIHSPSRSEVPKDQPIPSTSIS